MSRCQFPVSSSQPTERCLLHAACCMLRRMSKVESRTAFASDFRTYAAGVTVRDTPAMIELDEQRSQAILDETDTAHVACIAEGEPYVTAMSFVMVSGLCYFRTARGRRVTALQEDPRVCVEVSRPTVGDGWESVLFFGEARFIPEEDTQTRAPVVAAFLRKYREPAFAAAITTVLPTEHPMFAVVPERLSGRASGGGFAANTQPGRL